MRLTLFVAVLGCASPAMSYNLAKAMSGSFDAKFTSALPLFEVERCIVMLDLPAQPSVYRTPDKPNESLVHFGVTTPMAVQLIETNGKLDIIVWNGSKFADRIRNCGKV